MDFLSERWRAKQVFEQRGYVAEGFNAAVWLLCEKTS